MNIFTSDGLRSAILLARGEGTLSSEDGYKLALTRMCKQKRVIFLLPSGRLSTSPVALCGDMAFGCWSTGGTGVVTIFIIIAVAFAKL